MRFLSAPLVGAFAMAVAAVPHVPREVLAYRSVSLLYTSFTLLTISQRQ
jgi:hypothetical protein